MKRSLFFLLFAACGAYMLAARVPAMADDVSGPVVSPVRVAGQEIAHQPAVARSNGSVVKQQYKESFSNRKEKDTRAARLRAKIRAMEERHTRSKNSTPQAPKKLGFTNVQGADRIKAKIKAVEEDKSDSRKWLTKWYARISKSIDEGNRSRQKNFKKALERERAARKAGKRAM